MEEKCTGILSVWNNKIKKGGGGEGGKALSIERNIVAQET